LSIQSNFNFSLFPIIWWWSYTNCLSWVHHSCFNFNIESLEGAVSWIWIINLIILIKWIEILASKNNCVSTSLRTKRWLNCCNLRIIVVIIWYLVSTLLLTI
jgi:hypothetical protein